MAAKLKTQIVTRRENPGFLFQAFVDGKLVGTGHRDHEDQAERAAKREISVYLNMLSESAKRHKAASDAIDRHARKPHGKAKK